MVKIYKLIDPITNEIKYIGKTKDSLQKRLIAHLYEAYSSRKRKFSEDKKLWLMSLFKEYKIPKIELIEEVEDNIAYEKEKFYIKLYNSTLLNVMHNNDNSLKLNISTIKSVPIYQYDLEGNYIQKWKSISEASINLNIEHSNICYAAKGKRKLAGNYQWSYIQHEKIKPYIRNIHRKKVYEYDIDGNFIKEHSSMSLIYNIKPKLISKCCLGKLKSVYGKRFSFEKVDNIGKYTRKKRQSKI